MLDTISFHFSIRLVEPAHIGDGESVSLEAFCATDSVDAAGEDKSLPVSRKKAFAIFQRRARNRQDIDSNVLTVARGLDGRLLLPPTAMRGLWRENLSRTGRSDIAERLFGPVLENGGEAAAGRLWLFGGLAKPPSEHESALSAHLPFWSAKQQSFVLTGIQLDPDRRSVREKHLYNIEYAAEGTVFFFEGIYRGAVEQFRTDMAKALGSLKSDHGLSVGGLTGYGFGRAEITADTIQAEHRHYVTASRQFAKDTVTVTIPSVQKDEQTAPYTTLNLNCAMPFLSLDPQARVQEAAADWLPLMKNDKTPYISGKAIMQALRAIAARIELRTAIEANGYDYAPDNLPDTGFDRHLRKPSDIANLSSTQRLFGVPGFAKTLRIGAVKTQWNKSNLYKAQMIKLDAYTQAPIDGALVTLEAPFALSASVDLIFDEKRYSAIPSVDGVRSEELKASDRALLDAVLAAIRKPGGDLKVGHAQGAGFGWFREGV